MRDKDGGGSSKRRTFGRRHQPKPKRINGIRNRGLRQQLRSKREFTKTLRKILALEFRKRSVRSTVELRKIKNWMLWRSRPPPKKKETLLGMLDESEMWEHRPLGIVLPYRWKRKTLDDGDAPGLTGTS
jgi:hypothetical protein